MVVGKQTVGSVVRDTEKEVVANAKVAEKWKQFHSFCFEK